MDIIYGLIVIVIAIVLIWLFFKILGFIFNNFSVVIGIVIIVIAAVCIFRCASSSKSSKSTNTKEHKEMKALIKENKRREADRKALLSFPEIIDLKNNGDYKKALEEMERYKRVKEDSGDAFTAVDSYYLAEILYNIDANNEQIKPLLDDCIVNLKSVSDDDVKENLTQYINNACKNEICGQWIVMSEKNKSYPAKITFYSDGYGLIGDDFLFEWKSQLTAPNKYKVSISTARNMYYNFSFDVETHIMTVWQNDLAYRKR